MQVAAGIGQDSQVVENHRAAGAQILERRIDVAIAGRCGDADARIQLRRRGIGAARHHLEVDKGAGIRVVAVGIEAIDDDRGDVALGRDRA